MTPDRELLRQYAERHDEAAFAELVRRHVDLVYSVARRQCGGDAHLAQDVTQAVFADLARKARLLCGRDTLAGWLHTSARYAAGNAVRSEQRRRAREQEAALMNETTASVETNWESLRLLLDESVGRLNEADRDAIVLRFFQNKSHQEIGVILGLSENSANKRIERALDKLRGYFARRGVSESSAVLAAVIAENSIEAAPVGLAARAAASALAGAGSAMVGTGLLTAFFLTGARIKVAAVVVALIIVAAVTMNWLRAKPLTAVTVHPTLAVAVPLTQAGINKTPPAPQVAQPVVAAVDPGKPSLPTAADLPKDFDPRVEGAKTELRSNLNSLIQNSLYMINEFDISGQGDSYGLDAAELIQEKSFLDATPTLNAAGDLATYTASNGTLAEIRAVLVEARADTWLNFLDQGQYSFGKMLFMNVNGKWYLADQSLRPLMDDQGNSPPGNPTDDPFAK